MNIQIHSVRFDADKKLFLVMIGLELYISVLRRELDRIINKVIDNLHHHVLIGADNHTFHLVKADNFNIFIVDLSFK